MATPHAVPDGYHSLQPYLVFDDAEAAIDFYARAFGARQKMLMKSDRVNHAEIVIGDSVIMMADSNPRMQAFSPAHYGGSPVSLLIYTADCDAMYRSALAAGATSLREPADQDYGDRMSGVKDPFGYSWWIATPLKKVE